TTFTPSERCQSEVLASSPLWTKAAALLTRMWSPPSSLSVRSIAARISWSFETSERMKSAVAPFARSLPATSSPRSSTSSTTTRAPSSTNSSAVASPIPEAAPVTTATLSSRRMGRRLYIRRCKLYTLRRRRSPSMRVAMAQINTTVGDVQGNRDRVLDTLEKLSGSGVALVLFPELCLTGYPPRDLLGLHGFVDSNLAALGEIAARTRNVAAVVGFVDRNPRQQGRDFHNAAALVAAGKVQAVVHKTLLPTYDVFDEDRYFEPATATQVVSFCGR